MTLCCIGQRCPWQVPNTSHTIASLRFAHMLLEVAARVGPYEILSALGAGGMGEVYRAHDTKLGSCANLAGLVLPAGTTSDGLPIGLEFDALPGDDRRLLAVGLSLEQALGSIAAPDTRLQNQRGV